MHVFCPPLADDGCEDEAEDQEDAAYYGQNDDDVLEAYIFMGRLVGCSILPLSVEGLADGSTCGHGKLLVGGVRSGGCGMAELPRIEGNDGRLRQIRSTGC